MPAPCPTRAPARPDYPASPEALRPQRKWRARGRGSASGCASWLPPQIGSGRRVAAVDVLVAVLARVLHRAVGHRPARERVGAVVERARVARVEVAALAEIWLLGREKLLVVRAVGVVAVEAALPHRSVLPEKRPPLLGVAGQALLVDRLRRDHLRLRAVVRV